MISILKTVTIIGIVISMLLAVIGYILFLSFCKNKKNSNKLVKDTPLLKYAIIILTGVILTGAFGILLQILRFYE